MRADRIGSSRECCGTIPGGGIGLVYGFDSLPLGRADRTDPVSAAAARTLAAGLITLVRGLSPRTPADPEPGSAGPGHLAHALGIPCAPPAALDPLRMTRSILERALSGALPLLRSGALVQG